MLCRKNRWFKVRARNLNAINLYVIILFFLALLQKQNTTVRGFPVLLYSVKKPTIISKFFKYTKIKGWGINI